ncbi:hypothetical protein PGSY75_1237900, partial [Plasmodium gaboni]
GLFVGSFFFIWYITGEKIFKKKKKIVKENILLILRNLCYEIYTVLCETSKTTKHVYDMLRNESNTTIELSRLEEVLLNNGYKKKIEDVEKNVLKRFNISVEDFYDELKNYEKDIDVQKYLNSIKKMYNEALLGLQPKLPSIDDNISQDVIINLTSLIYKEKRKIYKTKIDSMIKNNEIIDIQNTLSNTQFFENLHKSTQHVEEKIIKENNNLVPNLFTFKYLVSYYSNDPNFLQKKKYLESKHGEKIIKILKIKTNKKKKKRTSKEDRQSSHSSVSFKSTPSHDVYSADHLAPIEKEEDQYSQQSMEMDHMDKDSHVDSISFNVDADLEKVDEQIEYHSESGVMQPEKEYYEGEHITIRYEEEDISEIYEEEHISDRYEEEHISDRHVEGDVSARYEEEPVSVIYEEEHISDRYEEEHVSDRYEEEHISDRYEEEHVSDRYEEEHVSDRYEEEHISDRFEEPVSDGHVEEPVSEGHVDEHVSDRYEEEHASDRHVEEHVSDRYEEEHISDRHVEEHVSEGHVDEHVSDRYEEEHISDRFEEPVSDEHVEEHISDRYEEPVSDGHVEGPVSDGHVDEPVSDRYEEEHISEGHVDEHISEGHVDEHISEGHVDEHISEGLVDEHIS